MRHVDALLGAPLIGTEACPQITNQEWNAAVAADRADDLEELKAFTRSHPSHPFYALADRIEHHDFNCYRIDLHPADFAAWQCDTPMWAMRDAMTQADKHRDQVLRLFDRRQREPRALAGDTWLCINRNAPRITPKEPA